MKTEPDRVIDAPTGTMERLMTSIGFDPDAKKPTTFTMESPLPEKGNDRTYMAHTDRMSLFLNVYAPEDGENKLHTHTNEDHAFVVLMGEAAFVGPNGETTKLRKNQGIMLPRNCLYTFSAQNGEPLVMLRVGATVDPDRSAHERALADGTPMIGSASGNNAIPCKFKPGAFFR